MHDNIDYMLVVSNIVFIIMLLNGSLVRILAAIASFVVTVVVIGAFRWMKRRGRPALVALALLASVLVPDGMASAQVVTGVEPPTGGEGPAICSTCAVFNVFNAYFDGYAKQAFVVIGNGVTVLAFGFALALGLLRYAMMRAMPTASDKPIIDLATILPFLLGIAALKAADTVVWRSYEALREWAMEIAIQLIAAGAGGVASAPAQATTDTARLVGTAEGVVWSFVDFAFAMLNGPSLWTMLTGDNGASTLVATVIFSFLLLMVYGGLLLYFAFIVLRSLIYLVMPVAFGTIIVGAACFKQTRSVFWSALRLVANAFLTIVGAGVAMGLTARILGLSQSVVKCYVGNRDAGTCGAEIGALARALGVPAGALTEAFGSFQIFSVLIILGACCWIVHYCVASVISQLTQTASDAGPLAMFAAATTGAIFVGGRAAYGAASLTKNAAGQGLMYGKRAARSLMTRDEP